MRSASFTRACICCPRGTFSTPARDGLPRQAHRQRTSVSQARMQAPGRIWVSNSSMIDRKGPQFCRSTPQFLHHRQSSLFSAVVYQVLQPAVIHRVVSGLTAPLVLRQCLVLASGPLLKLAINVSKKLMHRGLIKRPIVIPPASYHRIPSLRQFGKCRRCLTVDAPAPYHLPHMPPGVSAHSRQKTGEYPVLIADRPPRPKRKAEKREVHIWIGCGTVTVLAVHSL